MCLYVIQIIYMYTYDPLHFLFYLTIQDYLLMPPINIQTNFKSNANSPINQQILDSAKIFAKCSLYRF